MGIEKINGMIDTFESFFTALIDWFKKAYYFVTTYIDDPFDENN